MAARDNTSHESDNVAGHISISGREIATETKDRVNLDTVMINDNDWEEIKTTIDKVELYNAIPWKSALFGAFIPYAINAIINRVKGQEIDTLPMILIIFLWVIFSVLSNYCKFFHDNQNAENKVRIDYLKDKVVRIEKRKEKLQRNQNGK